MVSLWQKESCKFVRKILSTIMRGSGTAQVSFGELLRLVRGGDVPLQIEMPTPLLSSSAYTNTRHTFSTWPENQRLPRDNHNPFETAVTAIEPTTSFFPQERRAGDQKKRRHTKWGIPKSHQGPNTSLNLCLKFIGRDILFSRYLALHNFPPW